MLLLFDCFYVGMCFVRVFLAVQDAELIGHCLIRATGHVLASVLEKPEEDLCYKCVPVDILFDIIPLSMFYCEPMLNFISFKLVIW